MRWHRFLSVAIVLLARVAFAQQWSVTTSDFQTKDAAVRGLSADGLAVTWSADQRQEVIPLNRFVSSQWQTDSQAAAPNFTLAMRGGDRLVGEPGAVVGEQITWMSPTLGKVLIPFNRLVCISRGLNLSVPETTPKQDTVTLSNGDTVAGVVADCANLKVTVQTDSGPTSVPLDSVKRILFAATGSPKTDPSRAFRVHLIDASLITVADAQSDGATMKLTLKGKDARQTEVPMASVMGIEQLNGPIGWLSSMIPTENVQTPYLGGGTGYPARFDLSVDGSPLSFNGHLYDHGIGVHAYSRLTFEIDPQWKYFRTQYAINSRRDQPRRYADVTVRIKLDDKVVKEEQHFREGVLSPVVELELNGAKTITLECDYGDAGDTQAHLDWLQPALLHEKSTTATTNP